MNPVRLFRRPSSGVAVRPIVRTIGESMASSVGRYLLLCGILSSVSQGLFAQGGPPMLTDDPDTPGSGRWEINAAYTEERTSDTRQRSFPHVDVNYGLGEDIQLKYETGWVFLSVPNDGTRSGLDDSLIGVKWRFLDQSKAGINMSVYPQLQFENSTGSVARGIAPPGPNFLLPFEVSRDFGRFSLVGELGYQFQRSEENQWVYGILTGVPVSEDLELLAELRSFGQEFVSHRDVVLNLGLRKGLGSRCKLLASVGTGLTNVTNSTSFIAYLGIQLLLGGEKP
jgi:hypothetical protein